MVALSLFFLSVLPAFAFTSVLERDSNDTSVSVVEADAGASATVSAESATSTGSSGAQTNKIQLKGNTFCLATMDSTEVHLMTCSDAAAQKWIWEPAGDKGGVPHFTIKSKAEGVCLSKEPVSGTSPLKSTINLITGRPEYTSTRLRTVLESCGTAYTWGWYGERLCIRDCKC